MPADARAPDLAGGLRFGPYQFVRSLGEGGFARVWLALEDGPQGFRKQVAIKVAADGREAEQTFRALVNEARVGGCLHHPNVVDLYRIGEIDGAWYIALEYVDGEDLSRLQARVRRAGLEMPGSVVAEIGLRIAQALEHAHSASDHEGRPLRVVHRDLKPANVLVSRRGIVKVADFGIAKTAVSGDSTHRGEVRGTPYYMAPELWSGDRTFLPRMDLFALGVILWELCCGGHLLDATTMAGIAGRSMFGNAEQDAARIGDRYAALAPLVRRLIERAPEARAQSAAEVARALERIQRESERPGDLDFFLRLLERCERPRGERAGEIPGAPVREPADPAWSRALSVARGEAWSFPETVAVEAATVIGATQRWGRSTAAALQRQAASQAALERADTLLPAAPQGGEAPSPGPLELATPPERTRLSVAPRRALRPGAGLATAAAGGLLLALGLVAASPKAPPPELSLAPLEAEAALRSTAAAGPANGAAVSAPTPADLLSPTALAPVGPGSAPEATRLSAARPRLEMAGEPAAARPPAVPETDPAAPGAAKVQPSAATHGCLVLRSTPVGAEVRFDGADSGLRARGGDRQLRRLPPGTVRVEMGQGGQQADALVEVTGGARQLVHCRLLEPVGCEVVPAAGGCPDEAVADVSH
jgi:serine/threonine-protein kinase